MADYEQPHPPDPQPPVGLSDVLAGVSDVEVDSVFVDDDELDFEEPDEELEDEL